MIDDIKNTMWADTDRRRANMDAAEYKHLVLGLIFVKYVSDTFADLRAELVPRQPSFQWLWIRPEGITGSSNMQRARRWPT